ncbi:sterol desaturase family protein [Fulvivirga lutimaris]|uniref:sterol desaturase family protein n=1 Tax=Fulvivirga lutimaris TaxID=1819566 RepID=UPI001FE9102B|nr:sterol desaturase family protein [Fulvivirga lutimaris]
MDLITIILCALITIGTFLFMEGVAWFTHKYIMHGFLWTWHKSHHKVHDHALERNDLFALVFSVPSIGLLYYSTIVTNQPYLTAMGIGIFLYGLFYFIFHDVIVHQRIKWRPKSRSHYLNRMINAHYIHHVKRSKEDGQAFGFLYAPKKFEKTDIKEVK